MLQEQFKKILKEYREKNGVSRKQMATLLNVSESLIGAYERGERNIPLEIAEEICLLANQSVTIPFGMSESKTDANSSDEVLRRSLDFYKEYEDFKGKIKEDWELISEGGGFVSYQKEFESKVGKPILVVLSELGSSFVVQNEEGQYLDFKGLEAIDYSYEDTETLENDEDLRKDGDKIHGQNHFAMNKLFENDTIQQILYVQYTFSKYRFDFYYWNQKRLEKGLNRL